MAAYIGKKVKVTTDSGSFQGVIDFVGKDTQKLTLSNVVSLENGKQLGGTQSFYGEEINKLELISGERVETEKKESILRQNRPSAISRMKDWEPEGHLPQMHGPVQRATLANKVEENTGKNSGYEYFFIDTTGQEYDEAINDLKNSSIIGFSLEGIKIGRRGKLCLVQFAVKKRIYIFDALTMGTSCFDSGLAHIIESPKIMKIIHDCRQISDMLYHQYSLKMVNVFDTQVADVMVYKAEHEGYLPQYVNSLVACLFEYLRLTPDQVYNQRIRSQFIKEDQAFWSQRPLSDMALNAAAKNVMHLRELRSVLMERLLAECVTGINIYLATVRDLPNSDTPDPSTQKIGHELPREFCQLKGIMRESRESRDAAATAPPSQQYSMKENHTRILRPVNPDLCWSKHIWHSYQPRSGSERNNRSRSPESRKLVEMTPHQAQTRFPESQLTSKSKARAEEMANNFHQYLLDQAAAAQGDAERQDPEGPGNLTPTGDRAGERSPDKSGSPGAGEQGGGHCLPPDSYGHGEESSSPGGGCSYGHGGGGGPGAGPTDRGGSSAHPGGLSHDLPLSVAGGSNQQAAASSSSTTPASRLPTALQSGGATKPGLGRGRAGILQSYSSLRTGLSRCPLPQEEEGPTFNLKQCSFPNEDLGYAGK